MWSMTEASKCAAEWRAAKAKGSNNIPFLKSPVEMGVNYGNTWYTERFHGLPIQLLDRDQMARRELEDAK